MPTQKPRTSGTVSKDQRELKPAEAIFAAEVAKGANQTDAYRKAFPKSKRWKSETIWTEASLLAKKPKVCQRIEHLRAKVSNNLEISVERVLKERARLAFFDPRKLVDEQGNAKGLHQLDDDTAAAIAGFDFALPQSDDDETAASILPGRMAKVKIADKNTSLTALEKWLGMHVDKLEVTGKDGAALVPEQSMNEMGRRVAFLLSAALKKSKQ